MPGMDGHELAARAKSIRSELQILQLSGRERRRDGGSGGFLAKRTEAKSADLSGPMLIMKLNLRKVLSPVAQPDLH
jgi:CheY-like chemotaxis protein